MKPFIAIVFALLLVSTTTQVHAQGLNLGADVRVDTRVNLGTNSTGTNATGTRGDSRSEVRAQVRADMEARRASSTERRVAFQIEVAKRQAANVARVLTATVNRLEKIIDRIESRIEKVKAEGRATLEAEASIEAAEENLADAKASIALLGTLELEGERAQENFEEVRMAAAEAKAHIRLAHRNLVKAITSLAKGLIQRDNNATSSDSE